MSSQQDDVERMIVDSAVVEQDPGPTLEVLETFRNPAHLHTIVDAAVKQYNIMVNRQAALSSAFELIRTFRTSEELGVVLEMVEKHRKNVIEFERSGEELICGPNPFATIPTNLKVIEIDCDEQLTSSQVDEQSVASSL